MIAFHSGCRRNIQAKMISITDRLPDSLFYSEYQTLVIMMGTMDQ
jgi:hypothetical protein